MTVFHRNVSMLGRPAPFRTFFRLFGWASFILFLILLIVWETLAVYYSNLPESFRLPAAIAIAVFSIGTLLLVRPTGRSLLFFFSMFGIVVFWFLSIPPSNDRDWQPDVAKLSWAEIDGDRITVHNIRNCDYRTETDYTPAYYDKVFYLSQLKTVDLIAVYWMGPAIAHIFMSFGFAGGDQVAISIETRKEKGEAYSTIKGFFRQYELYYVVADERDVIRLRTNYRKDPPEYVYVYPVQGDLDSGRRLFMAYIDRINALKKSPEFYNSLTTNCTTSIWLNTRVNADHPALSWEILVSGYLPDYLYQIGRLNNSLSFAELKRRSYINVRAQAADKSPDFSRKIRMIE
jgi:hypothetical protein